MFRFESGDAFLYLWVIPVLLVVGWFFDRRRSLKMKAAIGSRLYPFLSSSISDQKRKIKTVLQVLVLLFFIVALARPQMGQGEQQVKSEGVEIIFAVDVSESMMADDVKPSRLAQVKSELSRLIDLMPGNKVGIVAYAGSAALISPLTNDPSAVKMYLESLDINSVSTQGTSFIGALEASRDAFQRGGAPTDEVIKVTRVVLLASDGEDHEQGALDLAKKMGQEGVRIFSVAFGTEKGGPIPVRDGMGFLKGYKKDRKGQTILTTVKGEALRALASAGQGSFYFATVGGEQTKLLVEDISQLEKTQFESAMATQYEENFQIYLFLGIILAFIELFLGERRSSFRFWKGRYEVPPL